MSEVKSTAEACYDARMALIKERDELARQVSELQLSQQNIINAFGISGEGSHSKLVIEYVHGLLAENTRMREAIGFATAPDMWQEQHDGMLDYRYVDWYVDVLNAALEPKSTDAFTAELRAQGVGQFAADMWKRGNELVAEGAQKSLVVQVRLAAKLADTYVDNLRAGRKG